MCIVPRRRIVSYTDYQTADTQGMDLGFLKQKYTEVTSLMQPHKD